MIPAVVSPTGRHHTTHNDRSEMSAQHYAEVELDDAALHLRRGLGGEQ